VLPLTQPENRAGVLDSGLFLLLTLCGSASSWPNAEREGATAVVKAADARLYEAKRALSASR